MTTRFEFGYGDGDIYRRRMEAQDDMFRQVAREQEELPEEDQQRLSYESDYYGFRGAGRRAGAAEPTRQPERLRRTAMPRDQSNEFNPGRRRGR
jgi:hypothetical protein